MPCFNRPISASTSREPFSEAAISSGVLSPKAGLKVKSHFAAVVALPPKRAVAFATINEMANSLLDSVAVNLPAIFRRSIVARLIPTADAKVSIGRLASPAMCARVLKGRPTLGPSIEAESVSFFSPNRRSVFNSGLFIGLYLGSSCFKKPFALRNPIDAIRWQRDNRRSEL